MMMMMMMIEVWPCHKMLKKRLTVMIVVWSGQKRW